MNNANIIAEKTAQVLSEGHGFSPPINAPWAMTRLLIDDVLNKHHIIVYSWIRHKETGEYASCSVTNATFAKHLKVSERYVSSIVNDLIAADLVRVNYVPGTTHRIRTLCTESNRIYWDKLRNFRPGTGSSTTPTHPELGVPPPPELGVPPNKNTIKTTNIQNTGDTTASVARVGKVSDFGVKHTKTSKSSPSAHKPSKSTEGFGFAEKDNLQDAAKQLAEALLNIVGPKGTNDTSSLTAKQCDPVTWIRTFKEALRAGVSSEELTKSLAAYSDYARGRHAAGKAYIITSTPKQFLLRRQEIANAVKTANAIAASSGKNSPQIDEKAKARAEAAYAEYERVNGHLPNWPKTITRESVIIMLAESMSRWKDFRNNSSDWAAQHHEVFASYAKKPTPGTDAYRRYDLSRWVIEKHNTVTLFADSMADFAQRWLGILNQAVKTFPASNAKAFTWKPDYVFFVKHITKSYALVSANDWQRIIDREPPLEA